MSYPTSQLSLRQLLLMSSILGLTACGGGGGGGGSTPTYTVTATAGANGTISPASATVTEGGTHSFTVTPTVGYQIDSVSGCGGTLSGSTYTTGAITANCDVTATFKVVTITVSDVSVVEGDDPTVPNPLTFQVVLGAPANGDVTVDYAIVDGTASAGSDYATPNGANGSLVIPAGTTTTGVEVLVNGDTNLEGNETIVLNLSNASANVTLGTNTAYGIIADDDSWRGPLNDTGSTSCYDNGATAGSCPNFSYPGQDADYGRDANAATNTATDGRAGFSFTKLDSNGTALADQTVAYATTPWSCVRDNNTNLMWEVKTTSGTHDVKTRYYWYDSNAATNGGDAGTSTAPNTESFILLVNNARLCGYNDWRLPTVEELMTIIDYNDTSGLMIDSAYFPNMSAGYFIYMTASSPANAKGSYFTLNITDGKTPPPLGKDRNFWAVLVRGR